jgi:hypothetical protein
MNTLDSNYNFDRAEMFASFSGKPILQIQNLMGDGVDRWFVASNFIPANPSNHIHINELTEGQDITKLLMSRIAFDQQLFLTQLDGIGKSRLTFPQSIKWLKIR